MGRTYTNKRESDEWDKPKSNKGKHSKHARNVPGRGMRIINSMSEDDYDDFESDYEYEDQYTDNTSLTLRKGKQNGY